MKRWQQIVLVLNCVIAFLPLASGWRMGQDGEPVELRIRLRYSDGRPVSGEPVVLERLPEEEAVTPACTSDDNGECTWLVERGLYQVLFDRPLDEVSALAVAEGGLSGFGLTVGSTPITYHFVFHSDGHVYFDAGPAAITPLPIIPTLDDLDHDVTPTRAALMVVEVTQTTTPPVPAGVGLAAGRDEPASVVYNRWRILLFIGLGLVIGIGLHLWARRPQTGAQPVAREEENPGA